MDKNKSTNIKNEMKECFEEIGFPDLANPEEVKYLNADRGDAGFIVPGGISFEYDDGYYSSAIVHLEIYENIPKSKASGLRELLNLANLDMELCHFSLHPSENVISFRTSLHVPGEKLPREKFKKLLRHFFKSYCQWLPSITKYLTEGGEPSKPAQSNKDSQKQGKVQYTEDHYRRMTSDLKGVFAGMAMPLVDEQELNDGPIITSFVTIEGHPIMVFLSISKERNAVLVQVVYVEPLKEKRIAGAHELALIFNNASYRNHICVLPNRRVGIMAGVIADPLLDKDELEQQLRIVLTTGVPSIPIILGHHNKNVSSREAMTELIDSQDPGQVKKMKTM